MFNELNNPTVVSYFIKNEKIDFIVRGQIECEDVYEFPFFGITISEPTINLRIVTDNTENNKIFINEFSQERIFQGTIYLPENSKIGVTRALNRLELWADFLCLAYGNPKIIIEPQIPIQIEVRVNAHKINPNNNELTELIAKSVQVLEEDDQLTTLRALWWFRKGCNVQHNSIFDCFTAYWNSIEVVCEVSGNSIKKGREIDSEIKKYIAKRINVTDNNVDVNIKAGHILEIYNRLVKKSIVTQMQPQIDKYAGERNASIIIDQCFNIKPSHNRLYQIRNNINHGNIQENVLEDVYRVRMQLPVVMTFARWLIQARMNPRIRERDWGLADLVDHVNNQSFEDIEL